jgi:uncharacterized protein
LSSVDAGRAHVVSVIETIVRDRCATHDAAHDILHLQRVVANARYLIREEQARGHAADSFVIELACWLHDIVNLPKGSGPAGESARRSAQVARELLEAEDVPRETVDAVANAVEAHSFSGGLRPATIEAAILQDADRLDALGAVGIARLWISGAEMGGLMHHPDDPAAQTRALNDRAWGLDHIERKLLRLPDLMNTESAREEAERRADTVRRYRDAFLRELNMVAESASLLERAVATGEIDAEIIEPGVPTPTVEDAAEALGVSPEQIIKSILCVDSEGHAVLAVVGGTSRVDRDRLAEVAGTGRLKLAAPDVVLTRTGYPAGGTPPVAHVKPVQVVIDTRVMALREVIGGGGRIDTLLRIRPDEIVRVTGATVAAIAG